MSDDQNLGISSSTKRSLESPETEYPAASRARVGLSPEEENARLRDIQVQTLLQEALQREIGLLRQIDLLRAQENARLREENDRLRQAVQPSVTFQSPATVQPLGSFVTAEGLNSNIATLDSIIKNSAHLFTENIEWLKYCGQSNSLTSVDDPLLDGIEYQEWDGFDQEITQFYQQEDVRQALEQQYPIPRRSSKAFPSNDSSFASVVSETLNQTINLYFVESPRKLYVVHQERTLNSAKAKFWFALTEFWDSSSLDDPCVCGCYPVLPIELKRPMVFSVPRYLTPVQYFQLSRDYGESSPIKQITSHMLKSESKYGVLTTCHQTWVLRKESDTLISISPTQSQENWLRTMYFACWVAKKYKADYSIPPNTLKKKAKLESQGTSEAHVSSDSASIFKSPAASTGQIVQGSSSSAQHSTSLAIQPPHFGKIELEITDEILGEGRSGTVLLGYLKQQGDEIPVAVKECNGNSGIQEEMVNEAKVLLYANQRGVKVAPKIYYSGYYDDSFVNVVELFDSEIYHQPDFWTQSQRHLVIEAVTELKSYNIVHRDIRAPNVFFSRDGRECKIIDYGFSVITPP